MANVGSIDVAIRGDLRNLQASFTKGERAVTRFGAMADKNVTALERKFGSLGRSVIGLTPALMSFARALGPALGIGAGAIGLSALADSAREAARSFAEIGREAARAGVGTDVFQELSFAALKSGVSVDALVDGLKELNLRADEFVVTGGGSAAEAFQRLGFTASDLATRLHDPVSLLDTVIERLRRLDTAAQIRISDEIFGGTGGEQFVRFLRDGTDSLAAMRREARELGLVISSDIIANAETMTRQLDIASKVVDTELKQAFIEATPIIVQTAQAVASVAREINRLIDSTRSLGDQSTRFLQDRARAIAETLDQFQRGGPREAVAAATGRISDLKREQAEIEKELIARAKERLATELTASDGIVSATQAATTAKKAQRDAYAETVASLQFELDQLGRTAEGQRLYNELLRAGVDLESEQAAVIADLVGRLQAKQAELDATAAATERATETADFFKESMASGLSSILVHGDDAADVIQRLALALADAALQAALLGEGPLASLLGGGGGIIGAIGKFIGGLFGAAKGGLVKAAEGGRIVGPGTGTSDSILARVSNGEYIVSAAATAKYKPILDMINSGRGIRLPTYATGGLVGPSLSAAAAAGVGGGGGVKVDVGVSVDDKGRLQAYVKQVSAETAAAGIQAYDRKALPSRVRSITGTAFRRGDI